ncbi:phage regulatory protein/antirepressor Ant [Paraburkholderia sp. Ac-20347]|uniref:phage regulatory protein/antirepressor Ant n=1 Tax=Paraburkholderia sp. Ac-20347 TaxID=2703892 RepID=UPI00197CBC9C|nr:phage regulatory protein/antirepressor Ant [Paraburkholderia sp. Ac-20347]MBN3812223.1 DNA-binding protein [Paraburkholderia sp. Ac-20347]
MATTLQNTADHGAPAAELVHVRDGDLVTDSLTIAHEFGRRHDNVLQTLDSLLSDGTVSGLEFKAAEYFDEQRKPRRMVELTERGALIAMPFIGGRKSRIGQARLVDAFMALRARASAPMDLANPDTLRALLQSLAGQSLQLQQKVETLEPQARAFASLSASHGSLCITDAAKNLGVRPKMLFSWLSQRGWIYRRGVEWIAYQTALERGLVEHRVTTIHRNDDSVKATTQVRVTAKGLAMLAKKLAETA